MPVIETPIYITRRDFELGRPLEALPEVSSYDIVSRAMSLSGESSPLAAAPDAPGPVDVCGVTALRRRKDFEHTNQFFTHRLEWPY